MFPPRKGQPIGDGSCLESSRVQQCALGVRLSFLPPIYKIYHSKAQPSPPARHRDRLPRASTATSPPCTAIWNEAGCEPTVLVADGIDVVRTPVPSIVVGRDLTHTTTSGITVICSYPVSRPCSTPDPGLLLEIDDQILLLGDEAAHIRFWDTHGR
jgi:hypothetical protein